MEEQRPVTLHCKACDIFWIAAYLPMEMGKFVNLLKRATCPKCGERKQVYLGQPEKPSKEPAE